MVFNDEDFIDLMDFCKDTSNFHESAKAPFDCISNISKSEGKHNGSLVIDYRYWLFNLDNICLNAHIESNGHRKNVPASVDGLYFDSTNSKFVLYFIEFKGLPINSIDYKLKLKKIIKSLREGHCEYPKDNCPLSENVFKSLNNAKNRFEDEILCQLKIKTTESLFFALPAIYKYYCDKEGINYEENLNDFLAWLLKSQKKFIVVFDDKIELSKSSKHLSFENRLKDKYNRFKNIANISPSVVGKSMFEKDFLHEQFLRIDFPAYTTVDFIKLLNRNLNN